MVVRMERRGSTWPRGPTRTVNFMVELSRTTVLSLVAGASALLLAAFVLAVVGARWWRGTSRRLAAVATRLDLPGSSEGYAAEDNLTRLERLAQDAVLRVSEAEARHMRLSGALDHVGPGVVVCDERGDVVYRNPAASALAHTAQERVERASLEAAFEALHRLVTSPY